MPRFFAPILYFIGAAYLLVAPMILLGYVAYGFFYHPLLSGYHPTDVMAFMEIGSILLGGSFLLTMVAHAWILAIRLTQHALLTGWHASPSASVQPVLLPLVCGKTLDHRGLLILGSVAEARSGTKKAANQG